MKTNENIIELDKKKFLTVHESQALLGVSRSHLYRLLKDEKVRLYKLAEGRKTYFKKDDLENLFN